MRRHFEVLLLCVCMAVAACRSVGQYVWVDDLPADQQTPATDREYVISIGDVLNVRVWNQDAVSGRARVRSDGKITLPFLNDVEAAGSPPSLLAKRIQTRLKEFIVNPVVTISVEEPRALQVSVLGEVTRPGSYQLEPNAGVLAALAAAGGMTEFASKDRIFVLRRGSRPENPDRVRIRFTYQALTQAEGRAGVFRLKLDDVVVVE